MVEAYWRIGQRIVEEEQGGKNRAEYGSFLIRNLARQLGEEFGKGLSVANLKNFRQFYLTFPDAGKSYALRSQLTWTHWRLIMRVESASAREYYIHEAAGQAWNTRQLERNIAYEGIDCLTGATFLLTIKRDLDPEAQRFIDQHFGKPASSPQGEEVGSWLLLDEGLTQATAAIQTAITVRCNQVIIDEFGPLEIQGKGLRPATDALMKSDLPALLVVREKLLEEVRSLYSPFKIHYVG